MPAAKNKTYATADELSVVACFLRSLNEALGELCNDDAAVMSIETGVSIGILDGANDLIGSIVYGEDGFGFVGA